MIKRLSLAGFALCLAGLPLMNAAAQNWTATKLNTFAKTNETTGAIIVLGTEGAWSPGTEKEKVYDGDTATFFDSTAPQGAWAGFELQAPKIVTRIRYMGRAGWASRMNGALFQGANTSDFSDAVTLYSHTAPAGWNGTDWIDVTLSTPAAFGTFTFLRFLSAAPESYGNAGEVEFYGADPLTAAPPVPVMTFGDSASWYAHLRWTVAADAMAYEVQRKRADEADYATIMTDYFKNVGTYTWRDPQTLYIDTQYRIRARNNFGDSAWHTFTAVARNAATGSLFGVPGSYGNGGMTFEKYYDADINTYFDGPEASGGNDLWGAIDLGTARMITGVRYAPRTDWASRMPGGQFQGANNADFNDAVTLHTVPSEPPYINMTESVLGAPAGPYRYVRYLAPNGGWGNAAEIEFDLAPTAPKAPISLAFSRSDITNDFPVLTWSFDTFTLVSSSHVYRATAPGGPYTVLTPAGVFGRTFTDTNLTAGVLYYYKIGALVTDGNSVLEGPLSAFATYRRSERIERTWAEPGVLKAGMTAFYAATESWYPAANVFDGSFDTFGDAGPANCKVGVDLGKPYGITSIRFSPRATFEWRVNGSVLQGSNDGALTPATTLATFANSVYGAFTAQATSITEPFRYVFATRLVAGDFYANLSELELYGWDPDNLSAIMTAPLSLTFTLSATSLPVSWTAGANATSYRLERMPADGSSGWATVGTTTDLFLTDPSPVFGVRYLYRVASVRTLESVEELAYSDSYPVVAYAPGSGTGLKGHYSFPYTKGYNPAEALIKTQVDATLDFTWGDPIPIVPDVPGSYMNMGVVWYGKLIVPHDGDYTFYLTTDDGAALRLDGQFLINDWYDRMATSTATKALTAGEHIIRIDYYQGGGGASARLEWGGTVERAVIPASQLIPLDLPSDDIGAWRGRTFNTPTLGYHAYDAPSGGITVYSYGLDLNGDNEGHHFVWQPISGPFLLEAKVTQNVDPMNTDAKALLMVRNGIESGSAFLAPARMATGQLGYKARLVAGTPLFDKLPWQGAPTNPCWMRIKRVGQAFTTQVRNDGGEWQTFDTFEDVDSVFNATVYAGVSVTASSSATTVPLQSATFSEIRLTRLFGTMIIVQ